MDTLNKIILPQSQMTCKYKGDQNIELGVQGMVDDNVAIGNCGITSLQKNAVISSFCETKIILLSQDIGRKFTCKIPCPKGEGDY